MPIVRPLLHFLPFILIYLVIDGHELGGLWNAQALVGGFLGFILLDLIFKTDFSNLTEAQSKERSAQCTWMLALYGWVIGQTGVLVWAITVIGTMSTVEAIGFTLSVGLVSSIGVIAAHELTHRRQPLSRALAELLMAEASYTHFCIEHVYGHHVNVATPRDPASAPPGMGLYRFLAQTIPGSLVGAWRIERNRLERKGLGVWSRHNKMLRYALELAVIYVAIAVYAGWPGVAFFFGQGAVAFILFETVNYIEHYGLQRREVRPGRYEPIHPRHSWNSNHRMTNYFLFNLGRHPDHHLDANREYQVLRHIDGAPQLPAGYPAMILLAFVPPLWHAVMDPRVAEWRLQTGSQAAQPAAAG
jgi:alkane 1-monooxygenase